MTSDSIKADVALMQENDRLKAENERLREVLSDSLIMLREEGFPLTADAFQRKALTASEVKDNQ